MRLEQLQSLVRVAELKSYARAAEALFLSQPAVYQQIRQLERYAGTSLVYVVGKEVRLTPAGEQVCDFAKSVIDAHKLLESKLDPSLPGAVRLGGASFTGFMAQAVARIRASIRGVIVEFHTLSPQAAIELVRKGEIDFAFGATFAPEDMDSLPCGFSQVVPIVSHNHPLAARGHVSIGEFFSEPHIAFATGTPRRAVDNWLVHNNITMVKVAARSDTSMAAKLMAIEFGLPALVVREAVSHELSEGVLVESL